VVGRLVTMSIQFWVVPTSHVPSGVMPSTEPSHFGSEMLVTVSETTPVVVSSLRVAITPLGRVPRTKLPVPDLGVT